MLQKTLLLAALFFCISTHFIFAQQSAGVKDTIATKDAGVAHLYGTWEIDLRPAPDADPYLKEFTLLKFENGLLTGMFYDTPFKDGRVNTAWGKVHFAFTTADGSGTYFHSGYLEQGRLNGISFSPSRGFMLPWKSVRKK